MGSAPRAPNQVGHSHRLLKTLLLTTKGVIHKNTKMRGKNGAGMSIQESAEEISKKVGTSMETIMNLITIDDTYERNTEFGRLNIGLNSDEKKEIMNLRKKSKGKALKKKKNKEIEEQRKLEEQQLEASIPTWEAIKHLNGAFIANGQTSNVNALNIVKSIEKDTREMQIEENQFQNSSPTTTTNLDPGLEPSTSRLESTPLPARPSDMPESSPDHPDDEKIQNVANELSEELKIDTKILKDLLSKDDTKVRNKLFKEHKIPKEIRNKIIEGRRRFKNRGYAKKKRDKDDKLIEDLTEKINELLEKIKANQVATVASRMKGKEYQERALQLSKELEEMERNIESLQENLRNQRTAQQIGETWDFNYSQEILPDVWLIQPNEK